MADNDQIEIQRKPELLNQYAIKKSTLHNRINAGLMVPAVSLGGRTVGYIKYETNAVLAAMCAGQSPEEIKQLVTELVAKRSELI